MDGTEQKGTSPTKSREGGSGPIFGIIIIIILLALGGIYYFTASVRNLQNAPSGNAANETETATMATEEQTTETNGGAPGTMGAEPMLQ